MNKLSQDNLSEILNFLDIQDIASLSSCNKNIETICKNIFKNVVIRFSQNISDETVEWLDKHNIKYELVRREIIDDTELWYKNGKLHRDNDLPAYIECNGSQEWWINGVKI
jgi:hypothetical protein